MRRTGRSGQQLLQYAVPELRPGAQGVRPAAVGLRPGGIQGKAGGADLRPHGHHPWEPELDHYPFRDLHRRDLRLHRRGQGLRHLLQGGRRNAHQEREPQGHQRAGCGGPALRGAEPGQPWHDQAALHRSGRLDRECGQHNQHYRLRRRPLRRRGRHQRQVFRGQGDAQIHQERRIYHGLRVQRRPGGLPSLRGGRLHPVQHGGVRHQRHELQQLLRDERGGQRRQRGGGS